MSTDASGVNVPITWPWTTADHTLLFFTGLNANNVASLDRESQLLAFQDSVAERAQISIVLLLPRLDESCDPIVR